MKTHFRNKINSTLRWRFIFLYFMVINSIEPVFAEIPQPAKDDPRYALGYLVVTYYEGVRPDGTGDSRPGIQQAIDDAFDNGLVVLFPSGTYQVSDVLQCYYWSFWDPNKNMAMNPPGKKAHVLVGSSLGNSRPVIKLSPDAVGFDDPSKPRPVLVWHYFSATNINGIAEVQPDDPFKGAPANFMDQPNVIFGWQVRNIDIDLNYHSGAIGGVFTSAQYSGVADMRITATGGYCGIYGVPGRNSYIANIEVEGGRYGIYNNGGAAGSCLVGARLYNQTEFAITSEDFCPFSIVGFDIRTNATQAVYVRNENWWSTASGTITLVDGKIEMLNGGTAINNAPGRCIYVGNVFIKGSENLLKSGTQAALDGSEGWTRVIEYTFNNQTEPSGTKYFRTFSLINGLKSQNPEPLARIESANPPSNLLTHHFLDKLPGYEGETDGTVNPRSAPYNAKGDGITDDWSAIQQAINNSPNGKVFLPKGYYVISKTLVLKPNTVLMGVDQNYSNLVSTSLWSAGSNSFMVKSADDPDAATFFGFIGFEDEATAETNITGGYIHWRAGRNSTIMMVRHDKKWGSYFGKEVRYNFRFSGNGGGRHFISPHQEEAADNAGSRQVYIEGTNQALTFYGLNVECTKTRSTNPNIATLGSNVEIVNSSNIRIHSMKREGRSPSVIIRDSHNIAVYGMGRLIVTVPSELGGYNQILGNSADILFATVVLDIKSGTEGFPTLREAIIGQPSVQVDWPDNVSIYKRGELTDIFTDETTSTSRGILFSDQLSLSVSCFPNPFNGEIYINFSIPASLKANLIVYNIQGQRIITLSGSMFQAGEHQVIWDGKDNAGNRLPAGVYFIKLIAGDIAQTKKITKLK